MAETQNNLLRGWETLRTNQIKLNFFNKCKEKHVIPNGLKVNFNLAVGCNNEVLVNKIQNLLDITSSKILDLLIDFVSDEEMSSLQNLEEVKREAKIQLGNNVFNRTVTAAKRQANQKLSKKEVALNKKFAHLCSTAVGPQNFLHSGGSRKITSIHYNNRSNCICSLDNEPSPYVRGLRKHRQNRKSDNRRRREKARRRRRNRDAWLLEVVEAELKKRDPINESNVTITDGMKSVLRLSSRFCPMPTTPPDNYDTFVSFEKFARNMRWAWFFHNRQLREMVNVDADSDSEPETDNFVMTPWYEHSEKQPPKGNPQLEAALDNLKSELFDVSKRRKVRDNLSPVQRTEMMKLRNLPNTSNAQVCFEDKGGRFVLRNLDYQDRLILESLENQNQFDEHLVDPTQRVIDRIERFCELWEDELNNFHPNIVNFLTDLSKTAPCKVKGLVKCHKKPRQDGTGYHDIRLLLASTDTPSKPASTFFQFAIAHIFPHLKWKMKDTKAILNKLLQIKEKYPDGLPAEAINVGCDVVQLYPSCDNEMGLEALKNWLEVHPNPDGLPTQLILDLGKICCEENSCEFLGRFFSQNQGTSTGPPHACDFVDIFVGELDKEVAEKIDEQNIESTDWTIFRDDGFINLLNGLQDLEKLEDILQNLHHNIKWEINPRGPSVPPGIGPNGEIVDKTVLEHLDLTIHFVDNHLETDIFAKDIPNYISRKSCHPPTVFPAVIKSVGLRLRTNCSLDRFLSPRIEEYTRYLLASDYTYQEVNKIMQECRALDREEMIKRPRRDKRQGGPRKFVLVTKWDPRQPNIHGALKNMMNILYLNPENAKCFPRGSIIAGFRRQRNLGEIIAPTKPKREARVVTQHGCFPCDAPRACTLHQSGALQQVTFVTSRYDGARHYIKHKLDCKTPNVIYYIYCDCQFPSDYVGSSKNMKTRWSKHKNDIRYSNWTACGLTRHFGENHRNNIEEAINNLKVTLVDCSDKEEDLKLLEDRWILKMGTLFTGLNSHNEVLSNRRRNYGKS